MGACVYGCLVIGLGVSMAVRRTLHTVLLSYAINVLLLIVAPVLTLAAWRLLAMLDPVSLRTEFGGAWLFANTLSPLFAYTAQYPVFHDLYQDVLSGSPGFTGYRSLDDAPLNPYGFAAIGVFVLFVSMGLSRMVRRFGAHHMRDRQ